MGPGSLPSPCVRRRERERGQCQGQGCWRHGLLVIAHTGVSMSALQLGQDRPGRAGQGSSRLFPRALPQNVSATPATSLWITISLCVSKQIVRYTGDVVTCTFLKLEQKGKLGALKTCLPLRSGTPFTTRMCDTLQRVLSLPYTRYSGISVDKKTSCFASCVLKEGVLLVSL